jgi:hypothetical protein
MNKIHNIDNVNLIEGINDIITSLNNTINLQLHKETLDIKTKIRLSHKISDFLDNTFNYDGNLVNKVHKLCLDLAHDYDIDLSSNVGINLYQYDITILKIVLRELNLNNILYEC